MKLTKAQEQRMQKLADEFIINDSHANIPIRGHSRYAYTTGYRAALADQETRMAGLVEEREQIRELIDMCVAPSIMNKSEELAWIKEELAKYQGQGIKEG